MSYKYYIGKNYTYTVGTGTVTSPYAGLWTYSSAPAGPKPKKTPEQLEKECEERGHHLISKYLKCTHCGQKFEL